MKGGGQVRGWDGQVRGGKGHRDIQMVEERGWVGKSVMGTWKEGAGGVCV